MFQVYVVWPVLIKTQLAFPAWVRVSANEHIRNLPLASGSSAANNLHPTHWLTQFQTPTQPDFLPAEQGGICAIANTTRTNTFGEAETQLHKMTLPGPVIRPAGYLQVQRHGLEPSHKLGVLLLFILLCPVILKFVPVASQPPAERTC